MFSKIQNPETGNWVNTNGIVGKRVLRNYLKQLGGAVATAPPLPPSQIKLEDWPNINNLQTEYNLIDSSDLSEPKSVTDGDLFEGTFKEDLKPIILEYFKENKTDILENLKKLRHFETDGDILDYMIYDAILQEINLLWVLWNMKYKYALKHTTFQERTKPTVRIILLFINDAGQELFNILSDYLQNELTKSCIANTAAAGTSTDSLVARLVFLKELRSNMTNWIAKIILSNPSKKPIPAASYRKCAPLPPSPPDPKQSLPLNPFSTEAIIAGIDAASKKHMLERQYERQAAEEMLREEMLMEAFGMTEEEAAMFAARDKAEAKAKAAKAATGAEAATGADDA